MKTRHILPVLFLVCVFGVAVAGGQELVQEAIPNWAAPASWSPARSHGGLTTMGAVTSPLPFIGVDPCRIADTRGNGFTGAYGPPSLAQASPRNFPLGGQCGIPVSAGAVSLNIAVTNTQGPGFISMYPQGGTEQLVSTLNYVAGQTVANAAVVPLGTGGGVTVVAGVSGTDLIIDTNGYYGSPAASSSNVFLGPFAGNATMTGRLNTGMGYGALGSNTSGIANTAIGNIALVSNTSGSFNTGIGDSALGLNDTGDGNTAIGKNALVSNTSGIVNTAIGLNVLQLNTTGQGNTASGLQALESNTTGGSNTASGAYGLSSNTTGSSNIAIGFLAGSNLTTGNSNIEIGNQGVAGESATIRIGTGGTHMQAFLAGVQGVMTDGAGIPVLIDANGQLGTISSSARFKDEIQDMGEATEGLLRLRPVTFRYKAQPEGRTQFGLIGEEVERVMPELVVCSSSGEVETVLYHEMPAMLLNELQKQQRQIEVQEGQIEQLKSELAALRTIIGQR